MNQPPTAPPISTWGHVWRHLLMLLISAAAWTGFAPEGLAFWQWENARWWFWTDLAIGLLAFVVVAWRRRFPVAVALVTNLLSAVSGTVGGPATLALFSLATRRRWREILPLAVVSFVCGMTLLGAAPETNDPAVILVTSMVAVIGVTIGWGMYIGSRRELLWTLRGRAETAESEQAARVAQARIAERARIAREMHDVLAHRISMVTMHAGALTYRQDLTAEQMRESAQIIQQNSHQALVELREVLGILREGPGDSAPERPQPSAVDIAQLIEEARVSGMRINVDAQVDVATVPDTIGRAAYRVVQEGLTNARKHAADTAVAVVLAGSPSEGLRVMVRNPLRVGTPATQLPESGLGLVGLAERVELAGGRLTHTVTPGRDFVLTAWLPWPS